MARRRRPYRVPFKYWIEAFRISQHYIAKAYDELPRPDLPAFGAYFRIALNKVFMPVLHKELHAIWVKKGTVTDEDIKAAILSALEKVTPEQIREALKMLGIEKDLDKYVNEVMNYLAKVEEKLKEWFGVAAPVAGAPAAVATA